MESTRKKIARHGWRAVMYALLASLCAGASLEHISLFMQGKTPQAWGGTPILFGIGALVFGVGGLSFKAFCAAYEYFHLRGAARRRADKGLPIP